MQRKHKSAPKQSRKGRVNHARKRQAANKPHVNKYTQHSEHSGEDRK